MFPGEMVVLCSRIRANYKTSVTKEEFQQKYKAGSCWRIARYLSSRNVNVELIDDTPGTEEAKMIQLLFDYQAFTSD